MTYTNRALVKRRSYKPSLDQYQDADFEQDQARFGGLQGATLALKYIVGAMRILRNYSGYKFLTPEDFFNQIECDQMELDILRMKVEAQDIKIDELTAQNHHLQGLVHGNSISRAVN